MRDLLSNKPLQQYKQLIGSNNLIEMRSPYKNLPVGQLLDRYRLVREGRMKSKVVDTSGLATTCGVAR